MKCVIDSHRCSMSLLLLTHDVGSETFGSKLHGMCTLKALGPKEHEIMNSLHSRVFNHILTSPEASENLKRGAR